MKNLVKYILSAAEYLVSMAITIILFALLTSSKVLYFDGEVLAASLCFYIFIGLKTAYFAFASVTYFLSGGEKLPLRFVQAATMLVSFAAVVGALVGYGFDNLYVFILTAFWAIAEIGLLIVVLILRKNQPKKKSAISKYFDSLETFPRFVVSAIEYLIFVVILSALFVVLLFTRALFFDLATLIVTLAFWAIIAIKTALFVYPTIRFFISKGKYSPNMAANYSGLVISAVVLLAYFGAYRFTSVFGIIAVAVLFVAEIILTLVAYNQRKSEFIEPGAIYSGVNNK